YLGTTFQAADAHDGDTLFSVLHAEEHVEGEILLVKIGACSVEEPVSQIKRAVRREEHLSFRLKSDGQLARLHGDEMLPALRTVGGFRYGLRFPLCPGALRIAFRLSALRVALGFGALRICLRHGWPFGQLSIDNQPHSIDEGGAAIRQANRSVCL